MKKLFSFLLVIIMGITIGMAQKVADVFKGSELLTDVFVNPLGIVDIASESDPRIVEEKIKQAGVGYKSMQLGPFGEMIRIIQPDINIGGVSISGMGICVNDDAIMLIYQSEVSESYKDMYDVLCKALTNYAKDIDQPGSEDNRFSIFMITDRYGIAVGTDDIRQTALACLLDIKNLQGFIGFGNLFYTVH